ncbi:MAG: DUF4124 domain-containing protein [Gammaproteobacteria bacterium]|nr:DUF4124 domain-containing protein [Gammaproteobacteria bacterium]
MMKFTHGERAAAAVAARRLCLGAVVGLLPAAGPVDAASVFRYVDDAGVTEYAADPPADGRDYQVVEVDAELPDAAVLAAQRRRDALLSGAAAVEDELAADKRERAQAVQAARAELAAARKKLREAQAVKDGDWQNLANGRRHLQPAYFDRVAAARAAERAARDALAVARRAH